jgi:hypothetical protein
VYQLVSILRYGNEEGSIVERFLCFVPIVSHSFDHTEKTILELLESFRINIRNCRGMTYDSSADIGGQYLDLQARVENASSAALNLTGTQ